MGGRNGSTRVETRARPPRQPRRRRRSRRCRQAPARRWGATPGARSPPGRDARRSPGRARAAHTPPPHHPLPSLTRRAGESLGVGDAALDGVSHARAEQDGASKFTYAGHDDGLGHRESLSAHGRGETVGEIVRADAERATDGVGGWAGRWWERAPGRGRPQPLALSLSLERTQTTQCTITRRPTCSWGGREREEGEAASGASRRGKAGMPVVARRPTPTAAAARPTASSRAMEPPCKPGIAHLAAGGLGRGGGPARGAGWEPRAGGRTPGHAAGKRAPPPARCGRRAKLHRPRRSARRPGA